jgi:predicted flap endonuclease-1-like 5' DNA nuclease
MPIPIDEIKLALNEIGLESPKVLMDARQVDGKIRLRITATCRPDRYEPIQEEEGTSTPTNALPIQDEEPINTLPQPAEGLAELDAEMSKPETSLDDDLTAIPGIGRATAAKLAAAGLDSFSSLANATDEDLLAFVNMSTVYNIRAWTS